MNALPTSINYYHPTDDGEEDVEAVEEEVVDHSGQLEEVAVDHQDHLDHHHKIELELDHYLHAMEKLL
jgi:DNA-binding PadR family transcriptional regulator